MSPDEAMPTRRGRMEICDRQHSCVTGSSARAQVPHLQSPKQPQITLDVVVVFVCEADVVWAYRSLVKSRCTWSRAPVGRAHRCVAPATGARFWDVLHVVSASHNCHTRPQAFAMLCISAVACILATETVPVGALQRLVLRTASHLDHQS